MIESIKIETDTTSGKSSSFGVSVGVSASVGLNAKGKLETGVPSVNFGASGSKSSFSGTDVTNREAVLAAGGTARIGAGVGASSAENGSAGAALTLDGAQLSANRVVVDAGSLAIASRQDTSTFASKDKSAGVSLSVTFTGQVSGSVNASVGRQSGDFASVAEQAGIAAGAGGFAINVAGNTDLRGAVIASTAAPELNQLTTGTLTASAIANRETFKATSTSGGVGIGANLSKDRTGTINTDQSGTALSGIKTGIGTISATPPAALSASGSQSSTTNSAIAQGGITITRGGAEGAESLGVAATISRDTSGANAALVKQFDDAKRQEINQGFEATRLLVSEVGTFFNNRGREEADLRKQAETLAAKDAGGVALRDPRTGAYVPAAGLSADQTRALGTLNTQIDGYKTFGAGGTVRLLATAFTGAAGSNVTGGLGSLVQSAAVNVLQGLAVERVKRIADGIQGDSATRETVRAALQAVVGCAGAAAGGSGGCASAATGAAASVVLNNLLSTGTSTSTDKDGNPLSLEDQDARNNLIATLIAALATAVGGNASAATTTAIIETQNNGVNVPGRTDPVVVPFTIGQFGFAELKNDPELKTALDKARGTDPATGKPESDDQIGVRYNLYITCKGHLWGRNSATQILNRFWMR